MSLDKITTAFSFGDKFGQQEAEKFRTAINGLASLRHCQPLILGGARSDRHLLAATGTLYDHPNYWDVQIDWTELATGWSVIARLQSVADSGSTITASIRNLTDSVSTNSAGVTATSYTDDPITLPVPAVLGLKVYRLQLKSTSTIIGCNTLGVIEIYG